MTMGLYYFNQRSGGWLKKRRLRFFSNFCIEREEKNKKKKKAAHYRFQIPSSTVCSSTFEFFSGSFLPFVAPPMLFCLQKRGLLPPAKQSRRCTFPENATASMEQKNRDLVGFCESAMMRSFAKKIRPKLQHRGRPVTHFGFGQRHLAQ